MAAENKSGFTIDGDIYEMPPLDTFTMDEIQVLYDYSGLTLEDFADDDEADLAAKIKNPGFWRALMHVSYQRRNPKLPAGKVKALIGSANVIDALEHLGDGEEEEPSPLELTNTPDGLSPSSSPDAPPSSGDGLSPSSDEPGDQDTATTTTALDTSFTLIPTGSGA